MVVCRLPTHDSSPIIFCRKRIEKDKRMRQAKQNKEDEAKRKKADLEERMRKKEETSGESLST